MDKPLRPVAIWVLQNDPKDPPYYALVVYRDVGGPRQYAPEEKRKLGLRAFGTAWLTFHPDGLLWEGTEKAGLYEYVLSHKELFATKEQRDAYYARDTEGLNEHRA